MAEDAGNDYSRLARIIYKKYTSPTGEFKGFIIEGEPRIGKSSYALQVMADVFKMIHPELTEDGAFDMALDSMYFKLEPFIDALDRKDLEKKEYRAQHTKIDHSIRFPVMTLDDASLHAGTHLHRQNANLYSHFENVLTTIGTSTAALLMTTPTYQALAKPMREYYDYNIVPITKFDDYRRLATIKEWYRREGRTTMQLRKIKDLPNVDRYLVELPNRVYNKYDEIRTSMAREAREALRAAVKAGIISEEEALKATEGLPK